MEKIKIYEKAIKTYGKEAQVDMAIEEMSELTKALLKVRRNCNKDELGMSYLNEAVSEEIADVEIMLEQLKMIYNNAEEVANYKKAKIERLQERLNKEE